MREPLWIPSGQKIKKSRLLEFSKFINFKSNNNFKKLWEWSVSNPEIFWSKFWDYSKIVGYKGKEIIKKDKIFNKTKFFPDSKINYAENLLKKRNDQIAINFLSEAGLKKIFHGICYTKKYVNFLLI